VMKPAGSPSIRAITEVSAKSRHHSRYEYEEFRSSTAVSFASRHGCCPSSSSGVRTSVCVFGSASAFLTPINLTGCDCASTPQPSTTWHFRAHSLDLPACNRPVLAHGISGMWRGAHSRSYRAGASLSFRYIWRQLEQRFHVFHVTSAHFGHQDFLL